MWQNFVDRLVYNWLGMAPEAHFTKALHFFIYDSVKVLFLLAVIIFLITMIRTWLPPEKTRKILSHKRTFIGNILAALFGIITPFCSCSAVPLFIGLVEAGVPLGVTFSFLISSPMINEIALVMLWGMFGYKIALLYIGSGLVIAVTAGYVIGKLKLEKWVEGFVYQAKVGVIPEESWTFKYRVIYSRDYMLDILKKVWPYVLVGIAVGGVIHGFVPQDFLARYAGKGNFFAVPLAVLIGIPLYSNAAGMVPVVKALLDKGLALGTALAFMMAVIGASFPEMVILRKVLKIPLLVIFFGILTIGIILVGYLFNAIL
ncbi:MAG: permease [bacterium]|nr:permease [bacterium]